jgi:hypothetical protein
MRPQPASHARAWLSAELFLRVLWQRVRIPLRRAGRRIRARTVAWLRARRADYGLDRRTMRRPVDRVAAPPQGHARTWLCAALVALLAWNTVSLVAWSIRRTLWRVLDRHRMRRWEQLWMLVEPQWTRNHRT